MADYSIFAELGLDTKLFDKGIKNAQSSLNSISKSIEGVQKLIKNAFSAVGITASVRAIVKFGQSCVQSATQAGKAFNILDNTIKATGADAWTSTKELSDLAKNLSDSTNYAITEIESMQSVLLGFRNITGDAFSEASEAIMDMATVMGMDLKSATQTVGKALDDPIKGLDSLRRQGFQFTDEQKEELAQLVKNGKQLEAQKIILEELSTTYGGASKAGQDSFAKQRHAIENFRDTLGGKLIPVMNVFAENTSKTLNTFTDTISKMNFTPVVNVVSNLSKIFSSTFNKISTYLKQVKTEVTDFISRFNFKPILSVIDSLSGVVVTAFNKIKSKFKESSEGFQNIKESLIDFSNSEMFQKVIDVINGIIDAVVFLWEEVERVTGEIRRFVVDKVIIIWNKIKELFENSQKALADSESNIKSWGDYFYKIFNNTFKIVQDLIYSVSALLKGDWEVAWEYAKLAVLRIADSVASSLDVMKSNFKDKMSDILNIASIALTVTGSPFLAPIGSALGLLGKLTDKSSEATKKASSKITQMVEETEARITELTKEPADTALNELDKFSNMFAGFTSGALNDIQDLANGTEELTQKTGNHFQKTTTTTENSYKKFSEWDSKLLQQRLEGLNEWSKEYHKITVQLIEEERTKALNEEENESEREKINKYYNKEIEKENKRHSKAVLSHIGSIFTQIGKVISKIASKVVAGIKTMMSAVKNVLSSTFSLFSKMLDLNIDDMLDTLLKFEDKILTFFYETLPQLPQFIKTVFESLTNVFQQLLNSFNTEEFANNILDMVYSVIDGIKMLLPVVTQIFDGIINAFDKMLESFDSDKLSETILEILRSLPQKITSYISTLLEFAKTLISSLLTALTEWFESGGLMEFVETLIDMISDTIDWLIDNIDDIVSLLIKMTGQIIKTLLEKLPEIIINVIKGIPDLLESIFTAIFDAMKDMVSGMGSFFSGIFNEIAKLLNIPGYAIGTQNAMRGLAVVGEQGPELVRFSGGEQVYNAKETSQILSGNGGNTWNITFNNTADTSAYTMMKQLRQYNRNMALNGII